MPNNNQPNRRLGQTETMTRNNQEERQERLNKLLKKNTMNKNTTNIPKDKEVDMIKFAEESLGFKLEESQKQLLNSIYNKDWNTISFSPAHSFSYSYQSIVMQMLKEIMNKDKGDVKVERDR